jgi:hypothetical protein
VIKHLNTLPGVTRKSLSRPLRWFYPDAFYNFQATGLLPFKLRPRDFGLNQTAPKIANIGVGISTDGTKSATGLKIGLTVPRHGEIAVTTDSSGVASSGDSSQLAAIAGADAIGDYAVTLSTASNPTLVNSGKLDLSPISNVTLMLEYDFTPRK